MGVMVQNKVAHFFMAHGVFSVHVLVCMEVAAGAITTLLTEDMGVKLNSSVKVHPSCGQIQFSYIETLIAKQYSYIR